MKILHLSAVKNWGGGGNHVENLCYELSKTNPEITNIIVVGEGGQFHDRLKKSNFIYDTIPLTIKIDPRAVIKLIKICRKEQIDIIHIHGPASLTLAVIADKFADLPPFIFSKKTSFPIKKRKQTLYKYNHPKIKRILCVSETTKAIAAEAILEPEKLKTIYHGTRIDNKTSDTPFQLRNNLNIPEDHRIIGNIGNHIKAKDLDTWVDTIDHLVNVRNMTHLHFVQIGSFSDQTPQIETRLRQLQLESNVHLLGYLPRASNFIPQFDALLLTSKSEGFPQVIYEALYHKTPVVTTNVGGIAEVIENGETGFLCEKGDAVALADQLIQVLENKSLAEQLTSMGYQRLMPKYTSENMARETLLEYQAILKQKK